MIYLLLGILSSALVSIIMRISTHRIRANVSMLAVNYLLCLGMSLLYSTGELFPVSSQLPLGLFIGCINGFFYLGGFVLLQWSVKKNGIVLSSTFMKLGLLIPLLLSICIYRETPNVLQILGFLLAMAAIVLMNLDTRQKGLKGFNFGLLLLLIVGGSGDAMAKIFNESAASSLSEQFLVYTFAVALILSTALSFVKKEKLRRNEILFGLLIGIPNFFSAKFILKALESIDAVIVYPTYSVATMLVLTLTGVCVFKERLRKPQWYALVLILGALTMLNL